MQAPIYTLYQAVREVPVYILCEARMQAPIYTLYQAVNEVPVYIL
jgi:hypothetical protein